MGEVKTRSDRVGAFEVELQQSPDQSSFSGCCRRRLGRINAATKVSSGWRASEGIRPRHTSIADAQFEPMTTQQVMTEIHRNDEVMRADMG